MEPSDRVQVGEQVAKSAPKGGGPCGHIQETRRWQERWVAGIHGAHWSGRGGGRSPDSQQTKHNTMGG